MNYEFVLARHALSLIAEYRNRAAGAGVDQLGFYIPPFTHAALEVLEQAIIDSSSIDDEKLAAYFQRGRFSTMVGEISFDSAESGRHHRF